MGAALATAPEHLLRDFASRGLIVLPPEALGIPPRIHETIYRKQKQLFVEKRSAISIAAIPEILEVTNAPGVVAACDRLMGRRWAIVPFTHNAPFPSGAHDQHWHKDDNGPLNARKQRHHHAVQVEMLYYPQAVASDMGPTATIPYSQYWAFNHEENHDNFAGADHLDFGYHLSGMERVPVSGPESAYDEEEIQNRRTRHDIRMRSAVANTGWPLVRPFEVAPLKAGSVVLYSHNLFHRGNHRRDDWRTWKTRPRFLWRFWLYRTTEPEESDSEAGGVDWNSLGVDAPTGVDLASAPEDAAVVWRYHHHWLQGRRPPAVGAPCEQYAQALFQRLHAKNDAAEPVRIGAAYQLAGLEDRALAAHLLGTALHNERETVRRAAMYGLAALGPAATDTLLAACESPLKWVRKAAVFALGEAGETTPEVLDAIAKRLTEDSSVYVRSVAAAALGCFGRRAVTGQTSPKNSLLPACFEAIIASLRREENRLGMNHAQERSIKLVRPTDECDVCEGIGSNYGVALSSEGQAPRAPPLKALQPVRSAVRENALWATVILCSHGAGALGAALPSVLDALTTVARQDRNIFSVGLALDALNRLGRLLPADCSPAARARVDELLREMPVANWESLLRGGLARSREPAGACTTIPRASGGEAS